MVIILVLNNFKRVSYYYYYISYHKITIIILLDVNRNETAAILAQKVITTAGPAKTAVAPQLLGTVPSKSSNIPSVSTPSKFTEPSESSGTPTQWKTALKKSSLSTPSTDSVDVDKSATPTQWSTAIRRTSVSKASSEDPVESSSTPQAWNNALKRGSRTTSEAEAATASSPATESSSTPQAWSSAIRKKSMETSDISPEKAELVSSSTTELTTAISEIKLSSPEPVSIESKDEVSTTSNAESNTSQIENKEIAVSVAIEAVVEPATVEPTTVESTTVVEQIIESSTSSSSSSTGDVTSMHLRFLEEQKEQAEKLDASSSDPVLASFSSHIVQKRSSIEPVEVRSDGNSETGAFDTDRDELEDSNMDSNLEKLIVQQSERKENDDDLAPVNMDVDEDDLSPVNFKNQPKDPPVAFI